MLQGNKNKVRSLNIRGEEYALLPLVSHEPLNYAGLMSDSTWSNLELLQCAVCHVNVIYVSSMNDILFTHNLTHMKHKKS